MVKKTTSSKKKSCTARVSGKNITIAISSLRSILGKKTTKKRSKKTRKPRARKTVKKTGASKTTKRTRRVSRKKAGAAKKRKILL